MVQRLLSITETLQADTADALAVALCHAHSRGNILTSVVPPNKKKQKSWREYSP
jgi:Holliday junction resolvasome RuvABC endonuclease subunit